MEDALKKQAKQASLGVPVCEQFGCLKAARPWKGKPGKFTKYCDECGEKRKTRWDAYVQFRDRMTSSMV